MNHKNHELQSRSNLLSRRDMLRYFGGSLATWILSSCSDIQAQPTPTNTTDWESASQNVVLDYGQVTPALLQTEVLPALDLSGSLSNEGSFGFENIQLLADSERESGHILRVKYPAGSASPVVTRDFSAPVGGLQFKLHLEDDWENKERLNLTYSVRFPAGFNFVRGGKLPGFYGGSVISGRQAPDGTNGFSTRYMWNDGGIATLYAYLPAIQEMEEEHGIHYPLSDIVFEPGKWYQLKQQIRINEPDDIDGRIQVWVDEQEVLHQKNVVFRSTESLPIEGLYFSTFFGGSDETWATPVDTYVDFTDFQIDNQYDGD